MYTQKKTIDNVHIVRERDRQRFRELLAVLSLGVPVGLFLLLFTWQNLEVIRLGREATRLQKVRTEMGEENKRLRFQLDHLTALDSVEKRASALGFSPTDSRAIVTVSGGPAPSPPAATTPGVDERARPVSTPQTADAGFETRQPRR